MDKLAQRAGVTALVLIASAGSALAYGMYRMALSLEPATHQGKLPAPAVAMLKLPELSVQAVSPAPAAAPLVAPAPPAAAAAAPPPTRPATDLPGAFGAALGTKPRASTAAPPKPSPASDAANDATASEELNLGFKSPARDASFNERGSRAFAVRQTGGAEQQRKAPKAPGDRISFETDLGSPDSR
jgi:hypothetical protein